MNWHGTIAFEGRPSNDGRIILPDALTWADEPIPLIVFGENGTVAHIGVAESVRREGSAIVAAGTIHDHINMVPILFARAYAETMTLPVAIELDQAHIVGIIDDLVLAYTSGRLRAISIASEPAWAGAKITFDETGPAPRRAAREPGPAERLVVRGITWLTARIDAQTEKLLERKNRR